MRVCILQSSLSSSTQVSETVLDTEGCNLLSVMSLDEVDATRTLSNDIIEVFRVLGIEACRRSLYNEIYRILESSAVNYRHLVRRGWGFLGEFDWSIANSASWMPE